LRVLIVKLSSLGDVLHAMPVVHDIQAAHPGAVVDWVVEPGFAPLVRRVQGIGDVVDCALRRWRRSWWTAATRAEWRGFRQQLQRSAYDAVIDLQGLVKSALVARLARGRRYGLANRTEGSSFEWPARWMVDQAIRVEPHIHALDRSRLLAARALGYEVAGPPRFGLAARGPRLAQRTVVFAHGASRDDKLWPEPHWLELGRRCIALGWQVVLPHGGEAERARAERLAAALGAPAAQVWPAMPLDALADRMAACHGVVGVDSGLSHLAVALDLPHLQLYNTPTAWRTGPQPSHGHLHQRSIGGTSPELTPPPLERVWDAWQQVLAAARAPQPPTPASLS
jgi:heptosyltransferase-1